MRPVNRGDSPQTSDFDEHRDAFAELRARLGPFCSYCERRIATNLAVEHIQPKSLPAHKDLEGRWENFLLGCVNCNSTKGNKDVVLANVLLPDRDNTAAAYVYTNDGRIETADTLSHQQESLAKSTLSLTGLDKSSSRVFDSNGQLVAIDRVAQRMETILIALSSKQDLQSFPSDGMRRQVARTAVSHGYFSIWMMVFDDDVEMRKLFVGEFSGTAAECFDPQTTKPISPRPSNGLADGSKV